MTATMTCDEDIDRDDLTQTEIRDQLTQVARWENAAAGYDVPDDDDADPDERATEFRSSARAIATAAVQS